MLPSPDPLLCDVALLYRQQHSWLTRWLRQRLNCSQSAADLAQDTFIRLLNKKLERAYLEALATLPEPVVPSLETQAILLETLIALDAALDGLERPVREAFLLSQVDGLGHAEIAQRLAVSITTVKRYIIKAGALCIMLDHSLDLP